MVAGVTRRATVETAGGGMLADSGISTPSKVSPKARPDYVSDVEVAEDATASPATPPAPAESNYAVYYRPGDLTGTRYQTLEECLQVRKQAGSGECIWK
jgi:hypothetical protein